MADVWISVQAIGGVGSEVEISAQEAKHALGARRLGTATASHSSTVSVRPRVQRSSMDDRAVENDSRAWRACD